jgi:3-deoxy-D-manno-octulosonic-acid transferase
MMLPALYSAATTLAAPGLRVMLKRRAARGKEIPARLAERQGIDPTARPPGKLLWLHAASVGETVSILPILTRLDTRVLLTTGTVTSANLLARRLPELDLADRFVPLDVPAWAERFLDHWRPDAAGFVESEIWPNLLAQCAARRIPLMLVNARLSARSFSHWKFFPAFAQRLFGSFSAVQAQSEADAERVQALGGPPSALTGNLKFAADPLPADSAELDRLRNIIGERPVWLAASTHPSEDPIVLAVHAKLAARHPGLLTIIVPRHPERGADLAAQAAGVPTSRRSLGEAPPAGAGVWIADTLGELGLFYRLAGIAFIGGSLTPKGGHNPLEAALLDCAILHGPDMSNCAAMSYSLAAACATVTVRGAEDLAAEIRRLLNDPVERAARAAAAAGVAADNRAVLDAVLKRIAPWLDRLSAHAASA